MSDSIVSLLADELDVPPKQAKKLLIAMLREVKKRARREGVRLPEFGTFRESDGQITFEPSPSLARAVNHRFEGLQSEDLATAPGSDAEEEQEDEGPSTITLGYQDSDWSPLDAEESEEDDEADTEEFEVPGDEEAADTEELQSPDTASADTGDGDTASEPEPEPVSDASDEAESSESEDLYPFVEDAPEGDADEDEEATTAERDEFVEEERESLSDIWATDDEDEPEPVSESDPEPFAAASSPSETSAAEAVSEAEDTDESSVAPDAPTSEVEIDPEMHGATPASEAKTADDSSSTSLRVLTGVLVVLLLGGAGWYVLGQRGTVQPPQQTFAQLKAQIQPRLKNLSAQDVPLIGTSPEEPSTTADAGAEPSSQQGSDASTSSSNAPTASTDDGTTSSSSESATTDGAGSPSSETTEQAARTGQTGASRAIDRAKGGWTIIVGSRTNPEPAQSLVEKYRAIFQAQNLPVDVLKGAVENKTRYRIGVGQFESQSEAQSFLERAGDKLPQGAWPLRL